MAKTRTTKNRTSLAVSSGVAARIDKMKDALVGLTGELCAIDTTNPPGRNYLRWCNFMADHLRGLGLAVQVLRVPPDEQARLAPGLDDHPRYCVLARWDVGAEKTLHYTGHYDVVPATSGWRSDPFDPVVRGGKLFARGAGDMKGSLAAAVTMIHALREAKIVPPWNIELSCTPDEETGGYAGLGWLVNSGNVTADAAVLCEGSSGPNLCYAHRGVLWLNVTVIGKPGHASNPKNGINALEKACGLIGELKKLETVYAKRLTNFLTRLRHPTLMIGGISGGGNKHNTIPERFSFTIDRRLIPEEKIAAVKAEIREVIRQAQRLDPQLKVKVDYPLYVPAGWSGRDTDLARSAAAGLRSITGKPVQFKMTAGFTDMHFLTHDGGIPAIGYGAGGGGAHGDNEFVRISSLVETAKFYAETALRMKP